MVTRLLDLKSLLTGNHSAFLFGPRGVGKTFLCEQFLQSALPCYTINLLQHKQYSRYVTQPELFAKDIEAKLQDGVLLTVLIDEVQKLPRLLDEVHSLIESNKNRIRFILTGSSARKLKRTGANLLAGRAWTLKLHPLTHLELDIDYEKALRIGTLPAIYLENNHSERTLNSYVETYLKEEILQEALVRKVDGFMRFLDLAAQMNGESVNYTKIANMCGVTTKTVQEYFSILVDTLIVSPLYAWTYSVRKQLVQAPKFYFFDCGVLNSIRGELKTELKPNSYRYGKLFETWVIQECIRLNDYWETDYKFSYWRTNTGLEVDLIFSKGSSEEHRLFAVEIKSGMAPQEHEFHGLLAFKNENPRAELYCFCNTPNQYKLGDILVLPWCEGISTLIRQ